MLIRGIIFLTLLATTQVFAAAPMIKSGEITRYETTRVEDAVYQHCYFRVDGGKEEMDLTPKEGVDCQVFAGKKVSVTIEHEKVKVTGQYGTRDVLWLVSIK